MKQKHITNKVNSLLGSIMALSLALSVSLGTASGQNTNQQPASKVAAQSTDVVLIPPTTGTSGWTNVLSATIKTPNEKDLFITVSLETGLFTQTATPPSSTATATVQVRVLLDGAVVDPPGVVSYGSRIQTLNSLDVIDLSLNTLDAASFSFVAGDVPVAVHTITVQAQVSTSGDGTFAASGAVGKGTLTIETVRLITTPTGVFEIN